MKNIILVASIVLLVSCHMTKITTTKKNKKEPKPSDYWSIIRSHPTKGFDNTAYFNGLNQITALKKDQLSRGPEHELDWRLEGPTNIGGRINVIKALKRGSDTLFAGTANGGVFRSYNGGTTWDAIFDEYACMSIGAIEVDPINNNIIYLGTGDRNFGGGSFMGNGLYKSTNFGDTWTTVGLSAVGIITSCSINPSNTLEIVVGALGNPYVKTNERGIYYTNDGGQTWTNKLLISDSSGVTEITRNEDNPAILLASSFNRINLPDRSIAAGLDSKIFKSIDGGLTWTQLSNGLPQNIKLSRVGVQFSISNPSKAYAVYIGEDYNIFDLYVSNDTGESWTSLLSNGGMMGLDPNATGGFGWYFGRIHVDPWNEDHLIFPGVNQYESYDGGYSWYLNVPEWWTYEIHADKHDLYFQDPQTILLATDGGLYKTDDAALTWLPLGKLPITQFYDVNANTFTLEKYSGGAQDNGTTSGNFNTPDWSRDYGGDGFKVTYISAEDNSVIYETQNAGLTWYDDMNGYVDVSTFEEITNWFTPYTYHESIQTMIAGSNRITKMTNPPFGFWEPITGDLTRVGLGTASSSFFDYHTISRISKNPFNSTQFIVGTSDGLVWLGTIDGEVVNISQNLPEKFVTSVNYSKLNATHLYVSMSGYYDKFDQALIFKSEDNGQSWNSISNNLPAIGINTFTSLLINEKETLFIGTDGGVFVSINDGQSWDLLGQNLPVATVSSIDIDTQTRRLVAGTYGRSMWSYDLSFWFNTSEINENELEELVIYPNPSNSYLLVNKEVTLLKIFDSTGELLVEKQLLKPGEKVFLDKFKTGIYFIEADHKKEKLVLLKE